MTAVLVDTVRHPKIYVWTDPHHRQVAWEGKRSGKGLVKVGYTDRDDVTDRIAESRGVKSPVATPFELLLVESAITDEGEAFKDYTVHKQLERAGVRRTTAPDGTPTEWFECTVDEVRAAIDAVKADLQVERLTTRRTFEMRVEQKAAVEQTADYFREHADEDHPPHYLWNAKMRFGKTFTAYQLAKHMGWTRILVLTYKPAVESSWREDLEDHVAFEGWRFKGKDDEAPDLNDPRPAVWFASFQDVLGTDEDGNPKAKNEDLYKVTWDAVIIDEYHFGAWREAARALYLPDPDDSDLTGDTSEKSALHTPDQEETFAAAELESELSSLRLNVRHYLYLSGTPFRALTNGEFLEDQIFNWTYSDEQRAKVNWSGPGPNPYAPLPKMHLLAYQMPEKLKQVALNNASEFTLTEFFRTKKNDDGRPEFVHETEVQKWLDLLRGQDITGLWANVSNLRRPPLPYENANLLRALQHTVWYLPSVDACEAMKDLLTAQHNTFYRDYEVKVAAGRSAGMGANALPPVEEAIGSVPQDSKTITLSCGKLLTGVTVPPWAGILMLRELKSPESYFQAAFRVQSPWQSEVVDPVAGGEKYIVHKQDCFVIDFSPNRALQLIVEYATNLSGGVASERDQEAAVEEFMEFLPVLSFDGYGMSQLRAADVIDYLTRGVTASMLARRWNSSELITLDITAMQRLLDDPNLLASLENVEAFRNITDDLTALISTHKELRQKTMADQKLSKDEKKRKKEATDRRKDLRKKLQHFITRIPAFMYLTDDRERTVKDVILQVEPGLFETVTSLSLEQFQQLVDAGVFDDGKMNEAVWKFRQFEQPSLGYAVADAASEGLRGGWTLARDERLAGLIDAGILKVGDELTSSDGATATVTADYGISVGGVRHTSPDEAAAASGADDVDGWSFWRAGTPFGEGTLQDLRELIDAGRQLSGASSK